MCLNSVVFWYRQLDFPSFQFVLYWQFSAQIIFLLFIPQASSRIEGNKLILEGVYIDEDKSPFKIVRYIENDRLIEVTLLHFHRPETQKNSDFSKRLESSDWVL